MSKKEFVRTQGGRELRVRLGHAHVYVDIKALEGTASALITADDARTLGQMLIDAADSMIEPTHGTPCTPAQHSDGT